jgi:magnesium-transporting ATPase (P-type)
MDQEDLISEDLKLTGNIHSYLGETARWARFLSVVGFAIVAMMILAAIVLPEILPSTRYPDLDGTLRQSFTSTGLRINFVILALLLFFPCLYLFRFAIKMKDALINVKQDDFEDSFLNLKSTFKFYGILTIVILAIYGLAFIVLLLTTLVAR